MGNRVLDRFLDAIFWLWVCDNYLERAMCVQLLTVEEYRKATWILQMHWGSIKHPWKRHVSELDIEVGWMDLNHNQYPKFIQAAARKKWERYQERRKKLNA